MLGVALGECSERQSMADPEQGNNGQIRDPQDFPATPLHPFLDALMARDVADVEVSAGR